MVIKQEKQAALFGLSLVKNSGNHSTKPKFVNPDNPDETYSGKGKQDLVG